MICPHCKKPVPTYVDEAIIKRAKKLRDQGYSLRDIEKLLLSEGHQVSFATLSRRFAKQEQEKK